MLEEIAAHDPPIWAVQKERKNLFELHTVILVKLFISLGKGRSKQPLQKMILWKDDLFRERRDYELDFPFNKNF